MADDHDDDPELTDREKELRKWNQPYTFQEFPKRLSRVTPATAPRPPIDPRVHDVTIVREPDPTVQNRELDTLAAISNWAVKEKKLVASPVADVAHLKVRNRRVRILSPEEQV